MGAACLVTADPHPREVYLPCGLDFTSLFGGGSKSNVSDTLSLIWLNSSPEKFETPLSLKLLQSSCLYASWSERR